MYLFCNTLCLIFKNILSTALLAQVNISGFFPGAPGNWATPCHLRASDLDVLLHLLRSPPASIADKVWYLFD